MSHPPEPFSAQSIHETLRAEVLTDDDRLPDPNSPALVVLARICNRLRQIVEGRRGTWRDKDGRWQEVEHAIQILCESLPTFRSEYVAEIAAATQFQHLDILERATTDLTTLDALIEAVRAAALRGIPHADMNFLAPHHEQRTDFAESLQKAFEAAVPGRSKATTYRFIVAVTPAISGETTDFDAVQQHLKRARRSQLRLASVNRDIG